ALLAAGRLHEHRRLGRLDDDVRLVVHPTIGDGYTLKYAGCGKGNDQCNYQHRCRDNDVTHFAPSPETRPSSPTARSPDRPLPTPCRHVPYVSALERQVICSIGAVRQSFLAQNGFQMCADPIQRKTRKTELKYCNQAKKDFNPLSSLANP